MSGSNRGNLFSLRWSSLYAAGKDQAFLAVKRSETLQNIVASVFVEISRPLFVIMGLVWLYTVLASVFSGHQWFCSKILNFKFPNSPLNLSKYLSKMSQSSTLHNSSIYKIMMFLPPNEFFLTVE